MIITLSKFTHKFLKNAFIYVKIVSGTRICVECLKFNDQHQPQKQQQPQQGQQISTTHRTHQRKNDYDYNMNMSSSNNTNNMVVAGEDDKSCSALTEMPIRKFRITRKCHGKITFLTKDLSSNAHKCNCRKGLHFELVH